MRAGGRRLQPRRPAPLVGVGFGPAFTGAYRTLVALAAPDDRAGLIAAIFTVGYLAFSVPALIAGAATSRYGLHQITLVYPVAIAVLVAAAAAGILFRRGARRPAGSAGAEYLDGSVSSFGGSVSVHDRHGQVRA